MFKILPSFFLNFFGAVFVISCHGTILYKKPRVSEQKSSIQKTQQRSPGDESDRKFTKDLSAQRFFLVCPKEDDQMLEKIQHFRMVKVETLVEVQPIKRCLQIFW